jgi:hypothetical protein
VEAIVIQTWETLTIFLRRSLEEGEDVEAEAAAVEVLILISGVWVVGLVEVVVLVETPLAHVEGKSSSHKNHNLSHFLLIRMCLS